MKHPIDNQYHYGVVYNLNGEITGFNLSPDICVTLTDDDIEKALEYYIKLHCPLENEQGEKMTREEAVEQLEYTILLIIQDGKDYMDERDIPMLKMAIQALKQESSKDCIDRRELLGKIASVCFTKGWAKFRADNGSNGTRDYIINYIKEMPPVTPQPKIGRWITTWEWTDPCAIFKCSNCSKISKFRSKYCPNCGDKKQEEEDE